MIDYGAVLMSAIAGFFLVFAGMLIGYFLWYRDRSEDDASRLRILGENKELQHDLQHVRHSQTSLESRCSRQKGQLNVLQQLCDDWSTSREQSERERANLEAELTTRRVKLDESQAEMELEKQKRIALEDQLHQQTQIQLEKLASTEQSWQNQHARIESALFQRQADLSSSLAEKDRYATRLHDAEGEIAKLQSQISNSEILLETAKKNASGLEQEYVTLESSLRENSELLNAARAQSAAAASARAVAEESLTALQQQFEQLQKTNQNLQHELKSLESLQQHNAALVQSVDGFKEELERVSGQRDLASKAEQAAKTVASGLQTRIDNQEATIHGLRDSRNEMMEKLKREMSVRSQLEGSVEGQRDELMIRIKRQEVELQRRSQEREHVVSLQRDEFQTLLDQGSESIAQLTGQRDELLDELSETRDKLATSMRAATESDQRLQELEAEAEEVATMQVRIRELESLLKRRESEMQQLNMSGEEAELLRGQFSNLQDQFAIARRRQLELEGKLQDLNQEREQGKFISESYQSQLGNVKTKLSASEETIRKLRRERAAVLARLANYRTVVEPTQQVISFTEAMQQQKSANESFDHEYGGHTTRHATRGIIYTSEPETRDDLKRISGIAVILEARLNDYGIYTFKQIIDWTAAEVVEFSELLTFPDRIQRDDWQGQARFFYNEKQATQHKAAA